MKVRDILNEIYAKRKDGEMNHHAKKFAEKHCLELESEITRESSLDILIKLSKAKQEKALQFIREKFEQVVVVVKEVIVEKVVEKIKKEGFRLVDLKNKSYKAVAKILHPDNRDTGDSESFQYLQEIKERFWGNESPKRDRYSSSNYREEPPYEESWKTAMMNELQKMKDFLNTLYPNKTEREISAMALSKIREKYGI